MDEQLIYHPTTNLATTEVRDNKTLASKLNGRALATHLPVLEMLPSERPYQGPFHGNPMRMDMFRYERFPVRIRRELSRIPMHPTGSFCILG